MGKTGLFNREAAFYILRAAAGSFTFRLSRLLTAMLCILHLSVAAFSTSTATRARKSETIVPTQWQNAWPVKSPLNVEWLGESKYQGITIRRLRFTGSLWDGQAQRIYAIYAQPPIVGNNRVPAILQIHGGGQTCYPENVNWFVKHGYACLAFDWTGPRDERPADQVTHW
jgi:hypothetical protein